MTWLVLLSCLKKKNLTSKNKAVIGDDKYYGNQQYSNEIGKIQNRGLIWVNVNN